MPPWHNSSPTSIVRGAGRLVICKINLILTNFLLMRCNKSNINFYEYRGQGDTSRALYRVEKFRSGIETHAQLWRALVGGSQPMWMTNPYS